MTQERKPTTDQAVLVVAGLQKARQQLCLTATFLLTLAGLAFSATHGQEVPLELFVLGIAASVVAFVRWLSLHHKAVSGQYGKGPGESEVVLFEHIFNDRQP